MPGFCFYVLWSYMFLSAYAHDDYKKRPLLPIEKQRFNNKHRGEDRITYQKRKLGRLEQIGVFVLSAHNDYPLNL